MHLQCKVLFKGVGHSRNGVFFDETSGRVTWALKNEPTLPDRSLVSLYNLTSQTSFQAAKYDSKWWHTVLNFGPVWRGISVGSDAL